MYDWEWGLLWWLWLMLYGVVLYYCLIGMMSLGMNVLMVVILGVIVVVVNYVDLIVV